MKKNTLFKKALSLILALLVLIPAFTLFALATPPTEAPKEWKLSEDSSSITDGEKTYEIVAFPTGYYVDMYSVYEYSNTVELSTQENAWVLSPSSESGLIIAESYFQTLIFADEEAKAELKKFLAGEMGTYRIEETTPGQQDLVSVIASSDAKALEALRDGGIKLDVTTLTETPRYHITAHDSTDSIATVRGDVFRIDGKLYFVNYSLLPNSAFDADGNLSFRSGEIEAFPIGDELSAKLEGALKSLSYKRVDRSYEDAPKESPIESDVAVVLFWIFFAIIGFILPAAPIAMGIVFARSEKRGKMKEWYILTAIGALWVILSIAFVLIAVL